MKSFFISSSAMLIILCMGCKKNNDENKEDAFAKLFKGKTWSGLFKYNARVSPDPYYIIFNEDGSFAWTEADGNYDGHYETDAANRKIKITFTSGNNFTATLNSTDEFSAITNGGVYSWIILSGEANSSTADPIIGTTWIAQGGGPNVVFNTANQANLSIYPGSYYRKGPSVNLTFITGILNYSFFGVINKNKMLGTEFNKITKEYYAFGYTKQ